MPAPVLLCWELGSGHGHLEPLGAVAGPLQVRGHPVILASRQLATARRFPLTRDIKTVQAPVTWPPSASAGARSLADMLLKFGYDRRDELLALVDGWLDLVHHHRPSLLVAEHSPTAVLAGRIAGLPVAMLGTGFSVPPARTPMPGFQPGDGDPAELRAIEERAVNAINDVLLARGAAPIDSLAALFPPAHAFLASYAEFEHFGPRAGGRYYGTPDQRRHGAEPRWPTAQGERVFAYMHPDYPHFPVLVRQLARLGMPTLLVAPGIGAAAQKLSTPTLRVQSEMVNLDAVAGLCALAICHCGHGTVARLLRHGLAPIVAPCFVEQTLLAQRLGAAGLVFAASPDPSRHDYAVMLDAAARGQAQRQRAADFARRHPADGAGERFEALADDLLALVR